MTWTSALGSPLEWPTVLHAKIARATHPSRDDVLDVLGQAKRIHEEALRLDAKVRELHADNLRLRHENEFMLRLLNEREP